MSKADMWMPLFISDYLADTMHLNAQQHGAYILLLMHHWRAGGIPDDDTQLCAIARCELAVWKRQIAPVVLQFFSKDGGKLTQKRALAERVLAEDLTDKRTKAGKEGAERRWGKSRKAYGNDDDGGDGGDDADLNDKTNGKANSKPNSKSIAKPLSNECQTPCQNDTPSPSPIPISSLRSEIPPNPQTVPVWPGAAEFALDPEDEAPPNPAGRCGVCSSPPGSDADFERFWGAYPRKVGKGQARKAWIAAIRKAEPGTIIAALRAQQFDPRERFQPHPATWLNGERWLDQAQTGDPVLRAAGLLDDDPGPDQRWGLLQ